MKMKTNIAKSVRHSENSSKRNIYSTKYLHKKWKTLSY